MLYVNCEPYTFVDFFPFNTQSYDIQEIRIKNQKNNWNQQWKKYQNCLNFHFYQIYGLWLKQVGQKRMHHHEMNPNRKKVWNLEFILTYCTLYTLFNKNVQQPIANSTIDIKNSMRFHKESKVESISIIQAFSRIIWFRWENPVKTFYHLEMMTHIRRNWVFIRYFVAYARNLNLFKSKCQNKKNFIWIILCRQHSFKCMVSRAEKTLFNVGMHLLRIYSPTFKNREKFIT